MTVFTKNFEKLLVTTDTITKYETENSSFDKDKLKRKDK